MFLNLQRSTWMTAVNLRWPWAWMGDAWVLGGSMDVSVKTSGVKPTNTFHIVLLFLFIYIYMYFVYFCFPVFRQNPAFSVSLVLVHSVWLWKCALDTPTLQPISLCRIQKLPKLHSLKLLIISPWKWMVGILLSFWEGPFSGAMLVSGRVDLLDDGQNLPNPNLILTSMFVLHLENQTVRNCMNQLYTVIVLFVI